MSWASSANCAVIHLKRTGWVTAPLDRALLYLALILGCCMEVHSHTDFTRTISGLAVSTQIHHLVAGRLHARALFLCSSSSSHIISWSRLFVRAGWQNPPNCAGLGDALRGAADAVLGIPGADHLDALVGAVLPQLRFQDFPAGATLPCAAGGPWERSTPPPQVSGLLCLLMVGGSWSASECSPASNQASKLQTFRTPLLLLLLSGGWHGPQQFPAPAQESLPASLQAGGPAKPVARPQAFPQKGYIVAVHQQDWGALVPLQAVTGS